MRPTRLLAGMAACGLLVSAAWAADDVRYEEQNGVRYQVTRQVSPRVIHDTKYEPRQSTNYRDRYTTEMQEQTRTYQVPVTQQQWVPGYQRTLNPFAPPVLSYRLMPVTRMETRTETVRVPVTRRDIVPETVTQHVPVTTQHLVNDVHEHRVAVGVVPGAANIAGGGADSGSSIANRNGFGSSSSTPDDTARDDSGDQLSRRK
jgi:hypothetical protein